MQTRAQPKKVERETVLRWVPIADMKISPLAQRDMNNARVNKIIAEFDLEQIGTPTVNGRDGFYYIIDGQHRVEALRGIGWGDQQIQCWTYRGLTEQEEAEKFLKLNDTLAVNAYAKFRIGVQAGRETETDINNIVQGQGLRISTDKTEGAISAVSALRTVYHQSGPGQLARALGIIRDAYGDAGLQAAVILGIGLMCGRYDASLDTARAVEVLGKSHGGVHGLLSKGETIRRQVGGAKMHCVAAAAVEIINAGRGGKKLPSWWHTEAEQKNRALKSVAS